MTKDDFLKLLLMHEVIVFDANETLVTSVTHSLNGITKDNIIPRSDMIEIYNQLRVKGKRVFILNKGNTKELLDSLTINEAVYIDDVSQFKNCVVVSNSNKKGNLLVPSVINLFSISRFSNKLKLYERTRDSLILGLVLNKCFYNSPFSINNNGELAIRQPFEVGYGVFGPMLFDFIFFINELSSGYKELWFLSREGWLLKRLYEEFITINAIEGKNIRYFLASRRATSFAAINNIDDIKEIMSQYYIGDLGNLTKSRLGIELKGDTNSIQVTLPRDIGKVMEVLKLYFDDILLMATKERNSYLRYIAKIEDVEDIKNIEDVEDIAVVDVGYMGTIQYYLTKILHKNIDGIYLSSHFNAKPLAQGAKCKSLEPVINLLDEQTNRIFKNQLYLEAVLKAPYGQLIKFDDKCEPIFDGNDCISDSTLSIQEGIISYVRDYALLLKKFNLKHDLKSDISIRIFDTYINSGLIDKAVLKGLSINDDYCSNGELELDIDTNKWRVNRS